MFVFGRVVVPKEQGTWCGTRACIHTLPAHKWVSLCVPSVTVPTSQGRMAASYRFPDLAPAEEDVQFKEAGLEMLSILVDTLKDATADGSVLGASLVSLSSILVCACLSPAILVFSCGKIC